MTDPKPSANTVEARLDEWGAAERSRLIEPGPQFLRTVKSTRPARGSRMARRLTTLLAAAAAVALAAIIALRPGPGANRAAVPGDRGVAVGVAGASGEVVTAGLSRRAGVAEVVEMLDAMQQREPHRAAPARASDAYCAGCVDDLMRL